MDRRRAMASTIALALALGAAVEADATPAQSCQRGKNVSAGTYASCRGKAEGKFALTGDAAARTAALAKCAARYGRDWAKQESRTVAAGDVCPSVGDTTTIQQLIDDATNEVASRLAGGPVSGCRADVAACLAACPPTAPVPATGQTRCWDDDGLEIPCAGTGQDGDLRRGVSRTFVDNGDGTITDVATGLTWEKLSQDGSIHDVGQGYTLPDAIGVKVATLNASAFAGHADWRLPNLIELETLRDLDVYVPATFPDFDTNCVPGCAPSTCSCTAARYWSSSTYESIPVDAWNVNFDSGTVERNGQTALYGVRAVRGGS